jgi:myo-inositol 2-dehydrogenase/D-chiro-inositol 1-dehydrogenase
MNFLILGAGDEELAWARAIARDPRHSLLAAFPGFAELSKIVRPIDLDDAFALARIQAVIVGGDLKSRGESLQRATAAGLPTICLHPPGEDSEAYYRAALSRSETRAVVIPDLPIRLHPAVECAKRAVDESEIGGFRGMRIEWPVEPDGADLARHVFPRLVDGVRALIGEVEAVTAAGDPPGPWPTESLIVHLRGQGARRAEVRIERATTAPGRIVVTGAAGSLTVEYDPDCEGNARVIRRNTTALDRIAEFDSWDRHTAILAVLAEAMTGRKQDIHPNLIDGTRAMELSEATVRSLSRGRTVNLYYEEITEAGTFKGVMTSIGCVIFLCILTILPISLIGPPLGFPGTIYLAYAIPPVLILFILLQSLRFALQRPREKRGISVPQEPDDGNGRGEELGRETPA